MKYPSGQFRVPFRSRDHSSHVPSMPFCAHREQRRRRQRRSANLGVLPLLVMPLIVLAANGFVIDQRAIDHGSRLSTSSSGSISDLSSPLIRTLLAKSDAYLQRRTAIIPYNTALNVWWYGGSESMEESSTSSTDSCELVAVRIERTSPNSRRIFGEITIPARIQDVWDILTDYNRLSIHVPNLVESRIERPLSAGNQGDGQYQCRLYQKGAQKIIGFEFGASVTMDMKEAIVSSAPPLTFDPPPPSASAWSSASDMSVRQERKITFACVDSFFFREFDGEWNAKEMISSSNGEMVETLLSYVVDVRPKGPVPVAALEWRIREDVPTNLRAVKKAALQRASMSLTRIPATAMTSAASRLALARDAPGKVQWYKDETMETYLNNDNNK